MTSADEFTHWLEKGGLGSANVQNAQTRASAIRTIERNLQELGLPFSDLEHAWNEDCFESLQERLRQMQEDANDGGKDFRILMPELKDPTIRLRNYRRWLGQYGQFLNGELKESNMYADLIREHVLERYIKRARIEGKKQIKVHVGTVHKALKLSKQWANVYQSLKGKKFLELAQVHKPKQIGKDGSPKTVFQYDLTYRKDSAEDYHKSEPFSPKNLILYGPPGTGKTYTTASEAVKLCDERLPENREEIFQIYNRLVSTGRIEFVTFHQSMTYEDFVEGRQPMTESDDGEVSSAGFRLVPVPGIFRRIAKRAQTSRGGSGDGEQFTVSGRNVFKMSIGEASNPEDAYLFEEAIRGGYTLLAWEDIDWSDDKFGNRDAIIEACESKGHTDLNATSGFVQMPHIFRNWVNINDLIIVSKGNLLFRAIGEFVGDYEYHSCSEDGYAHRRKVRWLWTDRQGVPYSEIYSRSFTMKSIYMLDTEELNVPALERYMNSQQVNNAEKPESFVLIIDEINRANISKVFGELITLLEPDKRLGQPNELKVRLPYSGEVFGVPSNLHILGTMNTADRSIALMDSALRRRFTFREMMPNSTLLKEVAKKCELELPLILEKINERIEYLYDREHQIGHAFFIDCESKPEVDAVMRHKIIPLLAEYFFEDWEKIAAVLGDVAPDDKDFEGNFFNRSVLRSPLAVEEGDDVPRFRWEIRSGKEEFDYTRLIEA